MPTPDEQDHGPKGTKADARRFSAWMAKGGFATRMKKIDGSWHVFTTGYNDKGKRDHEMLRGTR